MPKSEHLFLPKIRILLSALDISRSSSRSASKSSRKATRGLPFNAFQHKFARSTLSGKCYDSIQGLCVVLRACWQLFLPCHWRSSVVGSEGDPCDEQNPCATGLKCSAVGLCMNATTEEIVVTAERITVIRLPLFGLGPTILRGSLRCTRNIIGE